jgi:acetyl/propionyl-CoA carboxylase alpha subunit
VVGIRTNLAFFRDLLRDECFANARLHTGFIEEFLQRRQRPAAGPELERVAALVAARQGNNGVRANVPQAENNRWLAEGRGRLLR